jgi:hypothetical protein
MFSNLCFFLGTTCDEKKPVMILVNYGQENNSSSAPSVFTYNKLIYLFI